MFCDILFGHLTTANQCETTACCLAIMDASLKTALIPLSILFARSAGAGIYTGMRTLTIPIYLTLSLYSGRLTCTFGGLFSLFISPRSSHLLSFSDPAVEQEVVAQRLYMRTAPHAMPQSFILSPGLSQCVNTSCATSRHLVWPLVPCTLRLFAPP